MIDFQLFTALITYYFIMFASPGPNNAMLTASGLKFGFVRTLPHLIGIPLGHIFQIGLVCYGLGNLFLIFPQLQFYMKILCFVYLLYLGWKIIGSFSLVENGYTEKNTDQIPHDIAIKDFSNFEKTIEKYL